MLFWIQYAVVLSSSSGSVWLDEPLRVSVHSTLRVSFHGFFVLLRFSCFWVTIVSHSRRLYKWRKPRQILQPWNVSTVIEPLRIVTLCWLPFVQIWQVIDIFYLTPNLHLEVSTNQECICASWPPIPEHSFSFCRSRSKPEVICFILRLSYLRRCGFRCAVVFVLGSCNFIYQL